MSGREFTADARACAGTAGAGKAGVHTLDTAVVNFWVVPDQPITLGIVREAAAREGEHGSRRARRRRIQKSVLGLTLRSSSCIALTYPTAAACGASTPEEEARNPAPCTQSSAKKVSARLSSA